VVAYDVLSKTVVAYELANHRTGERALALRILRRLGPNCIVLMDRGFPSREMLGVLVGSGIPFVMRMVATEPQKPCRPPRLHRQASAASPSRTC